MVASRGRVGALRLGLIAALSAAQFVLSEYHHEDGG